MNGEPIRPPTTEDGYTREEIERYNANMTALARDPRTRDGANRPPWLVARVLADAARDAREDASVHEFNTDRPCGKCNLNSQSIRFHYRCATCSVDCTVGTKEGPATTDVHAVTRCAICYGLWQARTGALRPDTETELRAVAEGLELVTGNGGKHAEVAHAMLCRLELARFTK